MNSIDNFYATLFKDIELKKEQCMWLKNSIFTNIPLYTVL